MRSRRDPGSGARADGDERSVVTCPVDGLGQIAEFDPRAIAAVELAIAEIGRGRTVVICDERAANHGALVVAAEKATPEAINFMMTAGRGVIGLAMTDERCRALGLVPSVARSGPATRATAMASVDTRDSGVAPVSAPGRAWTIRLAADDATTSDDLVSPGHVVPLRVSDRGVLDRAAHPEAAADVARLAGLKPMGVVCALLNGDGSPTTRGDIEAFCARHALAMITPDDLAAWRLIHESAVERVVETSMPTAFGQFVAIGYRAQHDGAEHMALVKGLYQAGRDVLVHVHRGCWAGDVLHAAGCRCGERLDVAMRTIESDGAGVIVYLGRDGVGPGRREAERATAVASQILGDLGVSVGRVLDDDLPTLAALDALGLSVLQRTPYRRDVAQI